ncbi:MAG: D-alanine--D-alanine ligase [Planctomycetota bacterium]
MARRDLRIGMTFDLRDDYRALGLSEEELAEFDRPDTIDALRAALLEFGAEVDPIGGLRSLVARLARGDRWDLVFNICEGRHGFGREAQVPALLDGFGIPYTFCDPLVAAVTLHKGITKQLRRVAGVATAPFAVVATATDVATVELPFPLLGKPIAEGTSKGIGADAVVRDRAQLAALCDKLLARYRQPVLVETFLPGRELTVGVVGSGESARSIGALEVGLLAGADAEIATFRNKEDCERLMHYWLPTDAAARGAEALALRAWRAIGCRDGGRVDLRADASGAFQVLELNPLPGMHPTHSDLPILWSMGGREYPALVAAIVESALSRIGSGPG